MNEQFFAISEEKQKAIINAGFEVFGQNDYKNASTDDIAAKAGISKGSLFYYFHNKKSLYLFLFEQAKAIITEYVMDDKFEALTDFFDICDDAAGKKFKMLAKNPHILDFVVKAYYSKNEIISKDMNEEILEITKSANGMYFQHVDMSKFKDDVSLQEIFQMLAWLADGYMHDYQRAGIPLDLDAMMTQYHRWVALLKIIAYKEAYQ